MAPLYWNIRIPLVIILSIFGIISVDSARHGLSYEYYKGSEKRDSNFDSPRFQIKIPISSHTSSLNKRGAAYEGDFSSVENSESLFVRHPPAIQSTLKGKVIKPVISLKKLVKVESDEDGKRILRRSYVVQPIIQYVFHQYRKNKAQEDKGISSFEGINSFEENADQNAMGSFITLSRHRYDAPRNQEFDWRNSNSVGQGSNQHTPNYGNQGTAGGQSSLGTSNNGNQRFSGDQSKPHHKIFSYTVSRGFPGGYASFAAQASANHASQGSMGGHSRPETKPFVNSGGQAGSGGYSTLPDAIHSSGHGSTHLNVPTAQRSIEGYSNQGSQAFTGQVTANSGINGLSDSTSGYSAQGSGNGFNSGNSNNQFNAGRDHSQPIQSSPTELELSFDGYFNTGVHEPEHGHSGSNSHTGQSQGNQATGNVHQATTDTGNHAQSHLSITQYGTPNTQSNQGHQSNSQHQSSVAVAAPAGTSTSNAQPQQLNLNYGVPSYTASNQGQTSHIVSSQQLIPNVGVQPQTGGPGQSPRNRLRSPVGCLRCLRGLNAYFKVLVAGGIGGPNPNFGDEDEFGPPKDNKKSTSSERMLSMKTERSMRNFRRVGLRRFRGGRGPRRGRDDREIIKVNPLVRTEMN